MFGSAAEEGLWEEVGACVSICLSEALIDTGIRDCMAGFCLGDRFC